MIALHLGFLRELASKAYQLKACDSLQVLQKYNAVSPFSIVVEFKNEGAFTVRNAQHGGQYIRLAHFYGAVSPDGLVRFRLNEANEAATVLQVLSQRLGKSTLCDIDPEVPPEAAWETPILDFILRMQGDAQEEVPVPLKVPEIYEDKEESGEKKTSGEGNNSGDKKEKDNQIKIGDESQSGTGGSEKQMPSESGEGEGSEDAEQKESSQGGQPAQSTGQGQGNESTTPQSGTKAGKGQKSGAKPSGDSREPMDDQDLCESGEEMEELGIDDDEQTQQDSAQAAEKGSQGQKGKSPKGPKGKKGSGPKGGQQHQGAGGNPTGQDAKAGAGNATEERFLSPATLAKLHSGELYFEEDDADVEADAPQPKDEVASEKSKKPDPKGLKKDLKGGKADFKGDEEFPGLPTLDEIEAWINRPEEKQKEAFEIAASFGGGRRTYWRPRYDKDRMSDEEKRRCITLLEKFVGQSEGETGAPTISRTLLAKAIASGVGWDRIWVTDHGKPKTGLFVDTSGSCHGFRDVFLAVAYEVAKSHKDSVVLITGQGWCIEEVYDPETDSWTRLELKDERGSGQYLEVVKRYNLEKVVAVGDADGMKEYAKLSNVLGGRVWWLDNHACTYGHVKRGRNPQGFRGVYLYRCGRASDFIEAFEKHLPKG